MTQTEIGGLRAFSVDTPHPTVALWFRGGFADETLGTRGVAHLCEHLALSPFQTAAYEYNGMTDVLHTVFHASGPRDDLLRHMERLIGYFIDPPTDSLERERKVLLAEASQRPTSPAHHAMTIRFGVERHGMASMPEFGLYTASEDLLRRWISERYVGRNGVLIAGGIDATDVGIELPSGSRSAPPRPPAAVIPVPGWLPVTGRVMASGVVARSYAATVGLRAIIAAAQDKLRHELGVTYGVQADYAPLDAESAHLAIWGDTAADDSDAASEGLLRVLSRLRDDGVSDREFARAHEAARNAESGPHAGVAAAHKVALDFLHGRTDDGATLDDVRPVDVNSAIHAFLSTAMVMVAHSQAPDQEFGEQIPEWSERTVQGRVHQPAAWVPRHAKGSRSELVAGEEGITLRQGPDKPATVEYANCAGVIAWTDTKRTLYAQDGVTVVVDPLAWRGGDTVVHAIDTRLSDKVVAVPEPYGASEALAAYVTDNPPWKAALATVFWAILVVGGISNAIAPDPAQYGRDVGFIAFSAALAVVAAVMGLRRLRDFRDRQRWAAATAAKDST